MQMHKILSLRFSCPKSIDGDQYNKCYYLSDGLSPMVYICEDNP
jgi:hypothetical protein